MCTGARSRHSVRARGWIKMVKTPSELRKLPYLLTFGGPWLLLLRGLRVNVGAARALILKLGQE